MYFAVFSEDAIVYIGDDPTEAAKAFKEKDGVKIQSAGSMEELKNQFDLHVGTYDCEAQSFEEDYSEEEIDFEEAFSTAFETLLEKLDDMGINPDNASHCADKVTDAGKTVVKNVRHLGSNMMRTAGENFVWLGDLLKEEADAEEDEALSDEKFFKDLNDMDKD